MSTHLTPNQEVDIINAFTTHLEPVISIAKRHGITRQGVYKVLRRNGIAPTDHGTIKLSCSACGSEITRPRCQVRARKRLFCSVECYYAFVEGRQQGDYTQNRQGQRIARVIVSIHFDLEPGHIVHHEDRNNMNNDLNNLRVFANQGDHIRYHRLGAGFATPIWDGSTL